VSAAGVAAMGWAQTPIQLAASDGSTSMTLGVLAQGSFQRDSTTGGNSTDLGFRRLRFIAGGKIKNRLKFFVDSDTPYLGQHNSDWSVPTTFVQDLFVTYQWRDALQVDAGRMLVPGSYNALQSAASLLAIGYSPYSFLASTPTYSRVGRDEGVEARGYVAGKHLEYRVGAFRGISKVDANAPLRYLGRVVWYPLAAQTGFFYAGTSQGRQKMLGVGASLDHEAQYNAHGADVYLEWPLPYGDAVTVQADYTRIDGGLTFAQLPKQDTWLLEGGYVFPRSRFGLFGQFAREDIAAATAADSAALQGGVAYWARAHTLNLKVGLGRTMKDGATSHTQVMMQAQVFLF
jgi:hypothetical protein